MLSRLRRRLSRRPAFTPLEAHWELNHRVAHLYELHRESEQRVADEMAAAAAGYLHDFQRRADVLQSSVDSVEQCLAEATQHNAAALSAVLVEATRIAREHTEAAVSAVLVEATRIAREHADAATGAVFHGSITASREHAEAAIQEATAQILVELDRRLTVVRTGTEEQFAVLRRRIERVQGLAAPVS